MQVEIWNKWYKNTNTEYWILNTKSNFTLCQRRILGTTLNYYKTIYLYPSPHAHTPCYSRYISFMFRDNVNAVDPRFLKYKCPVFCGLTGNQFKTYFSMNRRITGSSVKKSTLKVCPKKAQVLTANPKRSLLLTYFIWYRI